MGLLLFAGKLDRLLAIRYNLRMFEMAESDRVGWSTSACYTSC